MTPAVAIGFRVKSGWATAVLLRGPASAPSVLDRRRVELSDPATPQSRQPYHAGLEHETAAPAAVARLTGVVARCARQSLDALLRDYGPAGRKVRAIGVVVGSTVDPRTIANPHIRAHAAEGQLFRTVLTDAAERRGMAATIVRERDLHSTVASALGRPVATLRQAAKELGRQVDGPWAADDKAAALVAWLVLSGRPRGSTRLRT